MNKELLEELLIDIKQFLKVDFEEDDYEIMSLIIAAESYLINAGCIINHNNFLYILALKMLVSQWYDDMEMTNKSNYSLDAIIIQLKYSYEVI